MQKGDENAKILDICFSTKSTPQQPLFSTVGLKHVKFWAPFHQIKVRNAVYNGVAKRTLFSCVTYTGQGLCITGAANGALYFWNGKTLQSIMKV
jgi:hypothetical protein